MSLKVWNSAADAYSHEQLADNFLKLDQHDHSQGRGSLIGGNGIRDGAISARHIFPGTLPPDVYSEGLFSALPTPTDTGHIYKATDTNQILIDSGTWQELAIVGSNKLHKEVGTGGVVSQNITSPTPVAITSASQAFTLSDVATLEIYVFGSFTPSSTGNAQIYLNLPGYFSDVPVMFGAAGAGLQTKAGGGAGSSNGVVSIGGELGFPRVLGVPAGTYTASLKASSVAGTAVISGFAITIGIQP